MLGPDKDLAPFGFGLISPPDQLCLCGRTKQARACSRPEGERHGMACAQGVKPCFSLEQRSPVGPTGSHPRGCAFSGVVLVSTGDKNGICRCFYPSNSYLLKYSCLWFARSSCVLGDMVGSHNFSRPLSLLHSSTTSLLVCIVSKGTDAISPISPCADVFRATHHSHQLFLSRLLPTVGNSKLGPSPAASFMSLSPLPHHQHRSL